MLITFRDTPVEIESLTGSQLFEHVSMLRHALFDDLKRRMVGLPVAVCTALWDATDEKAGQIDLGTPAYRQAALTPSGLAAALFIGLQPVVQNVTLLEVRDRMENRTDELLRAGFFLLGVEWPVEEPIGHDP